jgi:hypothetical protein
LWVCEKKLHRRELVVREHFPELAKAISKRYLENRKLRATVRRAQFCAGLNTMARELHAKGIVPNHKTLTPFMDNPSKMRCEWAISALRDIRSELGYESKDEQLQLAI